VRQRFHHALHQLPHARERALRAGLQPRRGPVAQLPDQPGLHPRVPGALSLAEEFGRLLGQPLDPALRRDGLPALPPEDGARRDRGRAAVLTTLTRVSSGPEQLALFSADQTPAPVGRRGNVRIGTCSWTDPSLIKSKGFYPRGISSTEKRLVYYAEQFPLVEV